MAKTQQKVSKKLKTQKLEDRIAPGMVGGGIIDPGMAEGMDDSPQNLQDSENSGEVSNTEMESTQYMENADSSGQYLEEKADTSSIEQSSGSGPYTSGSEPMGESSGDFVQAYDDEFANHQETDYTENQVTWSEADWVTANADGSYHMQPPEGVTIDSQAGLANFPVELANETLPLPESVEIQSDGGVNVGLPEGSNYIESSNTLILPENSVDIKDVPEAFPTYANPDGSLTVNLPEDGVTYNADTNSLQLDNYWANECSPENVTINEDGSVALALPNEGIEYNNDGTIDLTPEAAQFMDNPPPEYIHDMDYAHSNYDGSVTITPPEGVEVNGGVVSFPNDMIEEHFPVPEEMTINSDGTSNIILPEGTEYNPDLHSLTFAQDAINLDEVPEEIDAHTNPDGSITCILPQGIEYDGDHHTVHLNNYWTNEITPDHMEVTPDGSINVALPDGTEYYEDGSFTIPAEMADFPEYDAPDYLHDVHFSEYQADGSYNVHPPVNFQLDAEAGTLHIPYGELGEIPIDPDMQFNPDGTMDLKLPEGTLFDTANQGIIMPVGAATLDEIPEELNPMMNADGTISINLPDGINYNMETNSVHVDNYWTNVLTPEPVEISPDGSFNVCLPDNVEYHTDGSFTIPQYESDFMDNPQPDYIAHSPDWVNMNPDGSVTFEHVDQVQINSHEGTLSMNMDYMNQNFQDYYDPHVNFNSDGTMNVQLVEGTVFNSEMHTLTFPEGSMHVHEVPPEVHPTLNPDGTLSVQLQPGMNYDSATNSVHLDNYWTNEMTPEPVHFDSNGMVTVDLPHDTHYFASGDCNIPPESADFMQNPHPSYVDQGPDWAVDNSDGSVSVMPPEGMDVNADTHTLTMNYDMALEHFNEMMGHDFQLNPDGSADIKVPEGTQYNPSLNTMSFPPGTVHANELPPTIPYQYGEGGELQITPPPGITYNPDLGTAHLSNAWVNEVIPAPLEITPEGSVIVHLPEDTQYFDNGGFVISSASADFLDGGHPADGGQTQNLGLQDDIPYQGTNTISQAV